MNESENTTTQNLCDTVKAVLRGRYSNTGLPKEPRKKSNTWPNSISKATREGRNEELEG